MPSSQVGLVVMPIGAIDFIADSGQGHFHFDLIWNFFQDGFSYLFCTFLSRLREFAPHYHKYHSIFTPINFLLLLRSRCIVPKFTSPKTMYFEFQCSTFQKIENKVQDSNSHSPRLEVWLDGVPVLLDRGLHSINSFHLQPFHPLSGQVTIFSRSSAILDFILPIWIYP